MPGAQRLAAEPRGFDQGAEPHPARVGQHLEPVADEDAVLSRQGDDVGDGRQRDVVEEVQRQIGREAEGGDERLRQLERDAGAAEILVLRRAVGAARIEHRASGRQRLPGEMVVGDDDLDPRRARRGDAVHRRDAAVAGNDHAGPDPLRLGEPRGTEVIAVLEAMRHEGVHRRPRFAQHARQQGRGALAVDVVVAVDQNRPVLAHGARQDLHRDAHVGPAQRIGEAFELGTEERLGECGRREAALYQDGGERFGDVQLGGQRAGRRGVGRSRERPAGGNHSLLYNRTPHASQASIVAPRWISARRCVGTAVKQLPQEPPCRAKSASGALPRRMRS